MKWISAVHKVTQVYTCSILLRILSVVVYPGALDVGPRADGQEDLAAHPF